MRACRLGESCLRGLDVGEISIYHLRDPLLAANAAFRDQLEPPDKRTVVLAPDPAAAVDLSSWRAFARLPLNLPPFPPLPPEGGIK